MSATALLVIDVQHALAHGAYACFEADAVIARINAMADRARQHGIPVIFVQHASSSGELVRGSAGWQFAQGLEARNDDTIVHKRASDAFHDTELQALLQQLGIHSLVVCGMQSEFCVDSTVRRARSLAYEVQLVRDAHTTLDNGVLSAAQIIAHENVTLSDLSSYPGRTVLVDSAEVFAGNARG